eukprot:7311496-Alexandrium_andersonii.AAC.1
MWRSQIQLQQQHQRTLPTSRPISACSARTHGARVPGRRSEPARAGCRGSRRWLPEARSMLQ